MTKAKKETDSLINLRSARRPGDCGGALPGRPSNVCVGGVRTNDSKYLGYI